MHLLFLGVLDYYSYGQNIVLMVMDGLYAFISVLSLVTLSIKIMQIYVLMMILSPLLSVWLIYTDNLQKDKWMTKSEKTTINVEITCQNISYVLIGGFLTIYFANKYIKSSEFSDGQDNYLN